MPDPRPLPDGPLHFVGIGGAGMSAIAFVLASRGQRVSGSDPGILPATKARLESVGCEVLPGPHKAENVPDGVAALVVTDAVKGENPEVSEAERRGVPVFKRPEALGSLVNSAKTAICIAGTHGKTTTTGMVASILLAAGLNPTVLIGGDLPQIGGNARSGDPDLVVAEACEAYGGLDWLRPTVAVILNMEVDHLDFHGSAANFRKAFLEFGRRIRPLGSLVYWSESDLNLLAAEIAAQGACDVRPISCAVQEGDGFLFTQNVTYRKEATRFEACLSEGGVRALGEFELAVPGEHNLKNALLAIGAAYSVFGGFPEGKLDGIEAFTGTGRRFERLGETKSGVVVIDDYAHHPTEIRATLQGARQAYPDRRLVAVFQPHLPSRTQDFLEQFADALAHGGADAVYLTDIYLAREQPRPGLIELLAARISHPLAPSLASERGGGSKGGGALVADRFALPARLHAELKPGDVAIFMGAGNIREQAEEFLALGS